MRTAPPSFMSDSENLREAMRTRWSLHAREEQVAPPDPWGKWLFLGGRGSGKTRGGAEWVREVTSGDRPVRVALVAPTAADVRDTMIEGPSGLMSVFPSNRLPVYLPSKRRVDFPNGSVAFCYSAEEPERLRGPQHHYAWCDELCAWKYQKETWDQLMFGLRMGESPRVAITTTPKPTATLRSIMKDPHTKVTRATTYSNSANLAPAFLSEILVRYEGTRLGRQEINAEILEDVPGALWKRDTIEAARVSEMPRDLVRVVVGVDPSATATGDATGIITAGLGADGHRYVFDDSTMNGSPQQWGTAVSVAFSKSRADRIVYEANQGGDMVAHTLRTVNPNLPLKSVHATRGKAVRAEPISALYEQGKVHHVGTLAELEDEMCGWDPADRNADSPNRVDALVWALTELQGRRTVEARVL